jgi:hypothetical protein
MLIGNAWRLRRGKLPVTLEKQRRGARSTTKAF